MADGYDVDPDSLTAVGGALGTAVGDLGAASGPGAQGDAGESTALLLLTAGLQAEGMAALTQAVDRSAGQVANTATAYREAESGIAESFPQGSG